MNVLGDDPGGSGRLFRFRRRMVAVVLWSVLAFGCEVPFEPYQEANGMVFSIFGYLDLRADTQWVRVMPVRQNLFLNPDPIDAVVTLEHVGSGRTVTLKDSLFSYVDPRLGGVAYAHNFWTTQPLEPGATYRLRAARSDGEAATATVEMPADLELSMLNDVRIRPDSAMLRVKAQRVLFVDVFYATRTTGGDPAGSIPRRQSAGSTAGPQGLHLIPVYGDQLNAEGFVDMQRQEIRIVAARSDWPFHPGLPDLTVTLPGSTPSNVENGLGFLGGVATWTIPFDRCEVLAPRPAGPQSCEVSYDARSATIEGRVIPPASGDPPTLTEIRLRERFAGGGAIVRTWRTGWDGRYRFEGIEPGAELVLEVSPGITVSLPRLAPAERYRVHDINVPQG